MEIDEIKKWLINKKIKDIETIHNEKINQHVISITFDDNTLIRLYPCHDDVEEFGYYINVECDVDPSSLIRYNPTGNRI